MSRAEKIIIVTVYILMGFGGLWHVLNWFQPLMRTLAGPLMLIIACIHVSYIYFQNKKIKHFLFWCMGVMISGWIIERIGIQTHFPFGHYTYGSILQPQFQTVPLVIGFAWLQLTLSSLTFGQRIINTLKTQYQMYIFPLIFIVMILFDFLMEQAAPLLNYWYWQNQTIPLQNYVSWGVLGCIFSWFYLKHVDQDMHPLPLMGIHLYLAQLLYFSIVIIGQTL